MRAEVASALAAVVLTIVLAACAGQAEQPSAPPLENRLPQSIGGSPVEVVALPALDAEAGGLSMAPGVLEALGVAAEDVRYATTPAPAIGHGRFAQVSAFQYPGATADAIRAAYVGSASDAGIDLADEEIIGGKSVLPLESSWLYFAGDAAYLVAGDPDLVEEILAALP